MVGDDVQFHKRGCRDINLNSLAPAYDISQSYNSKHAVVNVDENVVRGNENVCIQNAALGI